MALIAMCCHDSHENKRSNYTELTVEMLLRTVNAPHRVIIVDNNSCKETKDILIEASNQHKSPIQLIIWNESNIGTAESINKAWFHRQPGEFCCKIDNDVIIHDRDWVNQMEEAITRMPSIGILGLKRKDLWERPDHPNLDFKSKLIMLPHETGQRWIVVEQAPHIIGTCQMYNPALLDKIGYLKQPGVYGYDDSLASLRSQIAGFKNCFLPHIEIEHIDVGGDAYCGWKIKEAERGGKEFANLRARYQSGEIPVYYNPFEQ